MKYEVPKYRSNSVIYLFCFVEQKSLSNAASKLNVTQPALSMQLKRFEHSFEYPIFEFQGKSKKLTIFGEDVYLNMKDILKKYEESFLSIDRKFSSAINQTLKIGCRRELITMVAQNINFDGEINFLPMSSEESIKNLIENRIDLAVSRYKPNSGEIASKLFFSSHSHIVVHKNWISENLKPSFFTNSQKMKAIPALVYGANAELFREWTKFLKINFEEFRIKYRCEDWIALLQLIECEQGFSIMPDTVRSTSTDILHVPIEKNLVPSNPHYFLYHKNLVKFPSFKKIFDKTKSN